MNEMAQRLHSGFEYPEELWDDSKMQFFPRGYIEID